MLVRKDFHIPLFDLISCLSDVIDMVNSDLVNHHTMVGYIAYLVGSQLELPHRQRYNLLMAGKLHDIGALSCQERLNTMNFELVNPHRHAEIGWLLLSDFKPLAETAELIHFHHVNWGNGSGNSFQGMAVPVGSHILHLADRVAVLLNKNKPVLAQTKRICQSVEQQIGVMFMPDVAQAFLKLAEKEYFWLDLISPTVSSLLKRRVSLETLELDLDGILSLGQVFSEIIDFRSRFTATHSSGVAASASVLARMVGFSETECEKMKVAGFLHDLGKLAVPTEILEKPGVLTPQERDIIRSHPYYTYRTLERISDMETINSWCSFHHEYLNGKGYPFHLERADLTMGARIMAVADVFTAITEDRPYRKGMTPEAVMSVLNSMGKSESLDVKLIEALADNFNEINQHRLAAQTAAGREYDRIMHQMEATS
ncbi:cyclic di-GMP phosphodiesterase response regulator RpfG [Geobacter sp. OR-1]|uniref:HD-GYP domain-containing protein n=1 Tax=Geobacter sp. OR-1 TaxID=1266765 RepID=UPI000543D0D7|nr:HD domain-containing phosphohydrolase [Geobacter sp. OR-1]GAM09297.1 cyclic di-GMP phosphodiesterase response regulator RpfG [Geobacter sp. OR-1]